MSVMRFHLFFILLSSFFVSVVCPESGQLEAEAAQEALVVPSILPDYWHSYIDALGAGAVSRASWCDVSDVEMVGRFAYYEHMLPTCMLYYPEAPVVDSHPLVMWVVHGTWASESAEYKDKNDPVFRSIMGFAAEMAEKDGRPVELVAYNWSGEDSLGARRMGASKLRMLAESFYSTACGYGPQWAIGHSHGVNVILGASQETSFEGVVSLGAPVLESIYSPLHVVNFYHFYSLDDPVQHAGSVDRRSIKKILKFFSSGTRIFSGQRSTGRVYNFRVMFDGVDPGHLSLKFLIPNIRSIIDIAKEKYRYHSHFNLNISNLDFLNKKTFNNAKKEVLMSIRDRLEAADLVEMVSAEESAADVISRLKAEVEYSAKQESAFSWAYGGKKMSARSAWWRSVVASWIELDTVVSEVMPVFATDSYKKYSLIKEELV